MSRVTKEQIAEAKRWDLLSYLQTYEPGELVKKHGEYRTKTHGSLVISKGLWCWNSQGIGGKTALDYFIKVRGMDFVDAVEAITGGYAAPYPASHTGAEKALCAASRRPVRHAYGILSARTWYPPGHHQPLYRGGCPL